MTRYDFIDCLRKSLSAMSDYTIVNENVKYYEEYIDGEIRKGRTETEILQELGDPRLLAKTIMETKKFTEEKVAASYEEERAFQQATQAKMPGWFNAVVVIAVVVLVFFLVGTAISALLPILLPVVLVFLVIKLIRTNHG